VPPSLIARAYAAELVALAPDVVVANGTLAATALKRTTRSIPVVFVVVIDPVGAGLVQSLAHPGGNITGFATFEPEIGGKWLELLILGFATVWRAIESIAPRFGLGVTSVVHRDPDDDIEAAIAAFAQEPGGGLIVLPTPANNASRARIFSVAARHRLPAIYPFRLYATDGGLMSYGFDSRDLFRRGASYVDRILKGEKPADLPVQAPTKYELLINLKAAKALRLEVPPTLLARADEVIE
jgi:putative ABC transport system substrate-binding protein